MSLAHYIVKRLIETGEADQDYDHDTFNAIVKQLDRAGFPGAWHREFDKYQGVYIVVPGVDKFWASYEGGEPVLIPEHDPWQQEPDERTEIPIDSAEDGGVDASYLIDYIKQRYAAQFAHREAQRDAEAFIDRALSGKTRRASTRRVR